MRTRSNFIGVVMRAASGITAMLGVCIITAGVALANGGPFVVKYPSGDPAAKGVLARLDPDLKPAREERLRVIKEDLYITFSQNEYAWAGKEGLPLADVKAEYRIQNPLDEEIEVDFGFPILRGIYVEPMAMMPRPHVIVTLDGKSTGVEIISNSAIYGLIRRRARETIEKTINDDIRLSTLVQAVRQSTAAEHDEAREALQKYLTGSWKWTDRDAVLTVEYCSIDLGRAGMHPYDQPWLWQRDEELQRLMHENLGTLAAIGEQKATQLLTHLAGRFNPKAASGYEAIFAAWGGDVRERSVDLGTGKVRPREVAVPEGLKRDNPTHAVAADPTIYARVDYLDSNAQLSDGEKASCKAILKNLPVIFTFAPMNLLHYRVKFAPRSEQIVAVQYRQYVYLDTREPSSYQLSYVVHPASLWKDFGPINLTVKVPEGTRFAASVACKKSGTAQISVCGRTVNYAAYTAELREKSGEIFVAVDRDGWSKIRDATKTAMK